MKPGTCSLAKVCLQLLLSLLLYSLVFLPKRFGEQNTHLCVLIVCCHCAGNYFKKRRKRKLQAAVLSAMGIYLVPSMERHVMAAGADEAAP